MNSLFEISDLHKTPSGLRWTYLMCFTFILGTLQLTKAQQSKDPIQKINLTSESSLEKNEEETITICGVVCDSTNQPLAFININFEYIYLGATTNENGEFLIDIPIDIYKEQKKLVFTCINYRPKSVPINQNSNYIEVVMNPYTVEGHQVYVGKRPSKRKLRRINQKHKKTN